ncbi:MAG TPA: NAD-dependent epimerase/dehydratase family protein [Acidimicrobiales bacterium]|nr:NAD-dependent epimerase/dehydratase family protein [Acidimicrobiales bacterium]
MNVLVTGGAGFIGSHIVDLLLDGGADVRVFDMTPGSDRLLDSRVDFVVGDLRSPRDVRRAVAGVDAVCHQAAMVGLGVDFGDVGRYVAHNDVGTGVLLGALWSAGFAGRLVLASSMVVYGEGRARCPAHGVVAPAPRTAEDLAAGRFDPRCPEAGCGRRTTWVAVDEHAPLDPRTVYAATKLHQEHLCAVWARESGATAVALRYHNVYGPRMPRDTPYAGVASIFLSALAAGRAPQVFEDGHQTRDFVHVRDIARANVIALTSGAVAPGAYNVASGTPHTVAEMATALAASFGPAAPAPRITGQWRLGDVRHVVASPDKAARHLGFEAQVGFEEGMDDLAQASVVDVTA